MERFNYNEAKEIAMRLGLLAGGMWIISFALVIYNLPSALAEVGYLLGIASIPAIGLRLRRMRRQVSEMGIGRTWWMAWFTFMCAVLLLTCVQYIYFRWMDDGRFFESIMGMITSKEVVEAYREAGGEEMLKQLSDAIQELSKISLRELVMSFMSSNLMIGLISSVLATALTLGSTYKKTENEG